MAPRTTRASILTAVSLAILAGTASSEETFTVTGRVTDDLGVGLGEVTVQAFSDGIPGIAAAEAVTSGSGDYALQVEAGSYAFLAVPPRTSNRIRMVYPNGPSCIDDTWTILDVHADLSDVDFALPQGGRLGFTLLGPDGLPVDAPAAILSFQQELGWCYTFDEIVLEDGVYRSPTLPQGTYKVRIDMADTERFESQFLCRSLGGGEDAAVLAVAPGQTADYGSCSLLEKGATTPVSGRVTAAADGSPVAGAIVTAFREDWTVATTTSAAADGRYTIDLPFGRFKLAAEGPEASWLAMRYWPGTLYWDEAEVISSDTPPADPVDFSLEAGGRFSFTLLSAQREPAGVACEVTLIDMSAPATPVVVSSWSAASGEYRSPPLPADRAYGAVLSPPAESAFLQPQGFCQHYNWQTADTLGVEAGTDLQLGTCPLIEDRYEPHTSSGTLFSFDENWISNRTSFLPWGTSDAAAGDLDNDGYPDLVVSLIDAESSTQGDAVFPAEFLTVLVNTGDNTFVDSRSTWIPFSYSGGTSTLVIADLDQDGFRDVVMGCNGPEWSDGTPWGEQDRIFLNVDGHHLADATSSRMPTDDPSTYGLEGTAWLTANLKVVDLDADGDLDIVRATPRELILLNDGTGVFHIGANGPEFLGRRASNAFVEAADVNDDGAVDLFFVAPDDRHLILLGDGHGGFHALDYADSPPTVDPSTIIGAGPPVRGDFDGDGRTDVYVPNEEYAPDSALHGTPPFDQLLIQGDTRNGLPTFEDRSAGIEQDHHMNTSRSAAVADIDNDGDADVLVANHTWADDDYTHPELRILLNEGSAGFVPLDSAALPPFVASPVLVVPLDSDLDGDLDIFLGNGFPTPVLLVNRLLEKHDLNGDGYVTLDDVAEVLAAFGAAGDSRPEDLDGDGTVGPRDLSLILRFQTTVRADNASLDPGPGVTKQR